MTENIVIREYNKPIYSLTSATKDASDSGFEVFYTHECETKIILGLKRQS